MTQEKLNKCNELASAIYNLERSLNVLNNEFAEQKLRITSSYRATIGQGCGNSMDISAFISAETLYTIAIQGATKQIKQLKKEFKDL